MMMIRRARSTAFASLACGALLLGGSLPAGAANDPYLSYQWGLQRVGADKAWATGTGAGITIAVVDTGVDLSHEDLRQNVVAGYDFVDRDNDPRDRHGHGTHVAGIAAARANNGVGVAGVAPDAKIMPIRVLDDRGSGFASDVDAGVRWAVARGAHVVNLSLGGHVLVENLTGGTLRSTVNYAWSNGVIPVIAAGNSSFFRTELRGANALIVTATAPDDSQPGYATGVGFARWGLAAPGGTSSGGEQNMILSTLWTPDGSRQYGYMMGTSMAAPHVAGAAAILRGLGLSPQQTVDRILATAANVGSSFNYGAGRLDVAAAVAGLGQPVAAAGGQEEGPPPPAAPATAPPGGQASPREPVPREPAEQPAGSPGATEESGGAEEEEAVATEAPQAIDPGVVEERSRAPGLALAAILTVAVAGVVAYGWSRRLRMAPR